MTIRVNTTEYERSHGRKPYQARFEGIGAWAFRLDDAPQPVLIVAHYREALKQAKQQAQHTVTVLP